MANLPPAGRGRSLTLPAWMTAGGGVPSQAPGSSAAAAPPSFAQQAPTTTFQTRPPLGGAPQAVAGLGNGSAPYSSGPTTGLNQRPSGGLVSQFPGGPPPSSSQPPSYGQPPPQAGAPPTSFQFRSPPPSIGGQAASVAPQQARPQVITGQLLPSGLIMPQRSGPPPGSAGGPPPAGNYMFPPPQVRPQGQQQSIAQGASQGPPQQGGPPGAGAYGGPPAGLYQQQAQLPQGPGQPSWTGATAPGAAYQMPTAGSVAPAQGIATAGTAHASPVAAAAPSGAAGDWTEHTAPDGRKYFYNKKTRQSSWEKPADLMSHEERADASTVWKEFTTSDGRKYYYNKITKQSKWTIPDELKAAREQAGAGGVPAAAAAAAASPGAAAAPGGVPLAAGSLTAVAAPSPSALTPLPTAVSPAGITPPYAASPALMQGVSPSPAHAVTPSAEAKEVLDEDIAEAKKSMPVTSKVNITPVEEAKPAPQEEALVFANKQDAKGAFKELLELKNVGYDWTWEQAFKVIVHDKRYGALKTLGERKQAFHEYQTQGKKAEKEEKRLKQKKAREDFVKMLENSTELNSTMRWSKASPLFEMDPRFKAVDNDREREELYEDYLVDLERKEREKARVERKENMRRFRDYLETCDFIKASTQWRKVQDRLEEDERCSKLERMDRLEVFQEYIRDLEKKEEEERQQEKEKKRRQERKNRDAFRELLTEHKAAGELNGRTRWRDYLPKVKETPAYMAVAGNASGSTPKELFEDFVEELEKQFQVDKSKFKDVVKEGAFKFKVLTSSKFEDFKAAVAEASDLAVIAEQNIKLLFEDLVERAKEKEEKEVKRKKRMADDFTDALRATKAVTPTSTWEAIKPLVEEHAAYKAFTDDTDRMKVFVDYVGHVKRKKEKEERSKEKKEKEKEKDKEKDKDKESRKKDKEREKDRDKDKSRDKEKDRERSSRKDKDKDKERKEEKAAVKEGEDKANGEEKKREREKDRKHRKRHRSPDEAGGEGGSDKEKSSRRSHKHSKSDQKKSSKHARDSDSEGEKAEKRHKRHHGEKQAQAGDREDGEVDSEDGEIR